MAGKRKAKHSAVKIGPTAPPLGHAVPASPAAGYHRPRLARGFTPTTQAEKCMASKKIRGILRCARMARQGFRRALRGQKMVRTLSE